MKKTVNIIGYDCDVSIEKFANNGQIALVLTSADTPLNNEKDTFVGEPISRPCVSLKGIVVGEKQTLIKDYSENKGIVEKLEAAGIVRRTGQVVNLGFSETDNAHLVDVLI